MAQVAKESRLLKSGEEKFEVAINGKKIINSNIESLKEVLRLVMLKLGIRGKNLPDDEEKQILLSYIIEVYGNHTCEEISLAFDLALSNKLDLEENEVKAYENFSCLYFSLIMNSYRRWTVEPIKKVNAAKRRLEVPYSERENLSEQEMEEWIKEYTEDKIFSVGGVEYIPLIFYDYLKSKKLISISPEQEFEYFNRAKSIIESSLSDLAFKHKRWLGDSYEKFKSEAKANDFSEGNLNQLRNLVNKICVFEYLKNRNGISQ